MLNFIRKFIPDLEKAFTLNCCYAPELTAYAEETLSHRPAAAPLPNDFQP
jgi:hypothetical protein